MTNQPINNSADQEIDRSASLQASPPTPHPTIQPPSLPVFLSFSLPRLGPWALLAGLLVAAIGASFAPWVARPSAALVLTAPDLAEFVKFLPEVRDGSIRVYRLLFLLPLFVATLTLPLISASFRTIYPSWVRWPALAIVIPLSLTLLPPVWSPGVLLSGEFRLQTLACLLCLGLVAASGWLGGIPMRPLMLTIILLSLSAPALAVWQFYVVRGAVTRAYASSINPGWGTWMTLVGFTLSGVSALCITRLRPSAITFNE